MEKEIVVQKNAGLFFELIQKFHDRPQNPSFRFDDTFKQYVKMKPEFFEDVKKRYDTIHLIQVFLWRGFDRRMLIIESMLECVQFMYVNFKYHNPNDKELDEKRISEIFTFLLDILEKEITDKLPEIKESLLEISMLFDSWLKMFLSNYHAPIIQITNLKLSDGKEMVLSLEKRFDEALIKQGYNPNEYFIHNALSRTSVCFLQGENYFEMRYLLNYLRNVMEGNLNSNFVVI